jgi:uncharacterized membrane protein HdeD (DUF308 family)
MAVVAIALTVERVAPAGQRIARAIGVVAVAAGSILIAERPDSGDHSHR